MSIFPTFPATIAQASSSPATPKYGRAPAFDFVKRDFKRDAQGRIKMNEGHRAWIEYGAKAVVVQRGAHIIYSDRYGVDINGTFQISVPGLQLVLLVDEIESMLMADPRTAVVSDFTFQETDDGGYVISWSTSPTIAPDQKEIITVEINP